MDRIRVDNADPSSTKYQTAAAISFDGKDYDSNLVDHRSLDGVMQVIVAAGYECEISWSPGKDRCTSRNFEYVLSDSDTTTASVELARGTVEDICGRSDRHSADTRVDVIRERTMRGSCTVPDPSRCRSLIENSPYPLPDGTLYITQPRWIRPTYFSTMAVYIGDDYRRKAEDYAKEINNVVVKYNREKGSKSFVTNIRISAEGRFFLFDPSEAHLAQRLGKHVMRHGFFPRPVYDVNSSGGNFVKADIVAHRDRLLASRSTTAPRASVRTNIPAVNRRTTAVQRGHVKIIAPVQATDKSSKTTVNCVEDMDLEQLQCRAKTIDKAIDELPTTRTSDQSLARKRDNLEVQLYLIRLRIENAIAKVSVPHLPPPHILPTIVPHAQIALIKAMGSPGNLPVPQTGPMRMPQLLGTYSKARGASGGPSAA
jgi:hypothetical protein